MVSASEYIEKNLDELKRASPEQISKLWGLIQPLEEEKCFCVPDNEEMLKQTTTFYLENKKMFDEYLDGKNVEDYAVLIPAHTGKQNINSTRKKRRGVSRKRKHRGGFTIMEMLYAIFGAALIGIAADWMIHGGPARAAEAARRGANMAAVGLAEAERRGRAYVNEQERRQYRNAIGRAGQIHGLVEDPSRIRRYLGDAAAEVAQGYVDAHPDASMLGRNYSFPRRPARRNRLH